MKMKAGRQRNNDSNYNLYRDEQYMNNQHMDDQHMEDNQDVPPRFSALGFEEGEWEMFVLEFPDYDPNQLVQQYLEISRSEPFNTNWNTEQQAVSADYRISDRLTKHDVVKDVMELYYHSPAVESNEMIVEQGGKRKRRNKNKTKKSKKSKKTKKSKKSKKSKKTKKTKKRRTSRQRSLRKY